MKEIRKPITDEQVEKEIDKLKQSKAVKLAKQERRVKTKRRQYLYQLRWLERRGRELQAQGVTEEELELLEQEADSSADKHHVIKRMIYVAPHCVNTIKELQQWKWKKDERTGEYLDEPVPFQDDAMAALRYGVEGWRKAKGWMY